MPSKIRRTELQADVEKLIDKAMGTDPVSKWRPFEVASVSIEEAYDGLTSIWVYAFAVPRPDRGITVFKFLTGVCGQRVSHRFAAFLTACATPAAARDADQLAGRYFAVRNNGRAPSDFGRLESALTQRAAA